MCVLLCAFPAHSRYPLRREGGQRRAQLVDPVVVEELGAAAGAAAGAEACALAELSLFAESLLLSAAPDPDEDSDPDSDEDSLLLAA
jgi:hypothetical protein